MIHNATASFLDGFSDRSSSSGGLVEPAFAWT